MPANYYLILSAAFISGLLLGLMAMWLVGRATAQKLQDVLLAKERVEAEAQRLPHLEEQLAALQADKVQLHEKLATLQTSRQALEQAQEIMRDAFQSLAGHALKQSTDEFLKLAKTKLQSERELGAQELEAKKGLIDQQLVRMTSELNTISNLINELEKDRVEKFGELAGQTKDLSQITKKLHEALASTKVRGQWGERMAEDILRLAGFIENVNYLKQEVIEHAGSRPDFTFLLPRNLKLNMDVKFPFDNYRKYLNADSEHDKLKYLNAFLRDVKIRIKEVTSREYINPEQNTVDYVILFIPNEHIYAFIHEQDSSILDDGIKNKVVLCSPITLFAVLAVIRQAVDNFALEQTSNEILSLLGAFKKQWSEFLKKLELLGKRIDDAQKEYQAITGARKRQLERPLNKIESLRVNLGLPVAQDYDEGSGAAIEEIEKITSDNEFGSDKDDH
jgi:DNA recombination protein RmuC